MVFVVKGSEKYLNPHIFDRMFRLRHDVFVVGRGWTLPANRGLEADQYDVDEAIYFVDTADDGAIQGCVRITPTERYSLLADLFPHLVEREDTDPRGPGIYEATRYIVLPSEKGRAANRAAKARLLSACFEWSFSQGLTHLQTVIDSVTLSSFVELSPMTVPLGLAHPYGGGFKVPGGGECLAIRCPVSEETIADIRRYGGLNINADCLSDLSLKLAS